MSHRRIIALLVSVAVGACSDQAPPEPSPSQANVLQWLEAAAHPVTTDAAASLADLDPLNAAIGQATIIGIGQSIAGSSEAARIRRRLVEDLVTTHGVRTIVIDASPTAASALQALADQPANTSDSVGAVHLRATCRWWWASSEALETLRWVHDYNQHHPGDRVVFRGISVERPLKSYSEVVELMERFRFSDPPLRELVRARLLEAYFYFDAPRTRDMECRYTVFLRDEPASKRQSVLAAMTSIYDTLLSSRSRLMAFERTTAVEYDSLLYNARQLMLWARVEAGVMTRDNALVENLRWTLDYSVKGEHVLILAGNGEVGRTPGSLGALLASKIGSSYFPIGIGGGDGEINAVVGEGTQFDKLPSHTQLSLPPGGLGASHESLLQRLPMRAFLLDLRNLPSGDVQDWFGTDRRLWRIDDRFTPKQPLDYAPLIKLSEAFDVFIWVRTTKPSRLM